jgi:hypothetical protein
MISGETPVQPARPSVEQVKAERIDASRLHGYPERADYLEQREARGEGLLGELEAGPGGSPERAAQLARLVWKHWTGWSPERVEELCARSLRLDNEIEDHRIRETPSLCAAWRARRTTAVADIDRAITEGLAARGDTRLCIETGPTPECFFYVYALGVREVLARADPPQVPPKRRRFVLARARAGLRRVLSRHVAHSVAHLAGNRAPREQKWLCNARSRHGPAWTRTRDLPIMSRQL